MAGVEGNQDCLSAQMAARVKQQFSAAEIEWLLKVYRQPLIHRFMKFVYSKDVNDIAISVPLEFKKKLNNVVVEATAPKPPPAKPVQPAAPKK
jgi:hypothetical protein